MYIHKLANAAASKLTVSNTATSLYDFIDAAGGSASDLPTNLNAVDLALEDNDVRILFDGNTPTAANGLLLTGVGHYSFRGVPLTKLKLIRATGADAAVSVQVGTSKTGESSCAALA